MRRRTTRRTTSRSRPERIRDIGSRQAVPDIAPASDEAVLSVLKRMKVPEGLEIKLWAAEPMLANPVAFNFDEKGLRRRNVSLSQQRARYPQLHGDARARTRRRTVDDRAALIHKSSARRPRNSGIESEIVRLVQDTNGDGVADKAVFADGFNTALDGIASGVLARNGKVWFTNIPSVWKFTEDPER